jgi:hypothetical protein
MVENVFKMPRRDGDSIAQKEQESGSVSSSFISRHVLRRAIADGLHPFYGSTGRSAPRRST